MLEIIVLVPCLHFTQRVQLAMAPSISYWFRLRKRESTTSRHSSSVGFNGRVFSTSALSAYAVGMRHTKISQILSIIAFKSWHSNCGHLRLCLRFSSVFPSSPWVVVTFPHHCLDQRKVHNSLEYNSISHSSLFELRDGNMINVVNM